MNLDIHHCTVFTISKIKPIDNSVQLALWLQDFHQDYNFGCGWGGVKKGLLRIRLFAFDKSLHILTQNVHFN